MKLTTDSDWPDDARTRKSHSGERAAGRRPLVATLVWTEKDSCTAQFVVDPHAWIGKCAARNTGTQLEMPLVHAVGASACCFVTDLSGNFSAFSGGLA